MTIAGTGTPAMALLARGRTVSEKLTVPVPDNISEIRRHALPNTCFEGPAFRPLC